MFGIAHVSGVSGVGKTSFVSQYVQQSSYTQVVWLNASHNLLLNQMWLYIQECTEGLELKLPIEDEVFYNFSQSLLPDTCIVLDNEPEIEFISLYLEKLRKSEDKRIHIITISPLKQEKIPSIDLKEFGSKTAEEYITKALSCTNQFTVNFAMLFRGLPLALKQATSHLSYSKLGLQDYCKKFEVLSKNVGLELIKTESTTEDLELDNQKTVFITKSLILSDLEASYNPINSLLVKPLCYFDRVISQKILQACIPKNLNKLLTSLADYGLYDLSSDQNIVSINPCSNKCGAGFL